MRRRVLTITTIGLIVAGILVSAPGLADMGDYVPSEQEINKIAKTLYGECRSDSIPTMEKAAVVWCILNRCDAWGRTVDQVITPSQFTGYSKSNPVSVELKEIAEDVVLRWQTEKIGLSDDVGRVLPNDYLYFAGRDGRNHFRKAYGSREYWQWYCEDPYEEAYDVPIP